VEKKKKQYYLTFCETIIVIVLIFTAKNLNLNLLMTGLNFYSSNITNNTSIFNIMAVSVKLSCYLDFSSIFLALKESQTVILLRVAVALI